MDSNYFDQLSSYFASLPVEDQKKFKDIGEYMYSDLDIYTKEYIPLQNMEEEKKEEEEKE